MFWRWQLNCLSLDHIDPFSWCQNNLCISYASHSQQNLHLLKLVFETSTCTKIPDLVRRVFLGLVLNVSSAPYGSIPLWRCLDSLGRYRLTSASLTTLCPHRHTNSISLCISGVTSAGPAVKTEFTSKTMIVSEEYFPVWGLIQAWCRAETSCTGEYINVERSTPSSLNISKCPS